MTKYFKATFPNGDVVLRSSKSREYTHAWQVGGTNGWDWEIRARRADKAWAEGGFTSREDLAFKASQSGYDRAEYRYVVPCEEIDAKTYRELKRSPNGRSAKHDGAADDTHIDDAEWSLDVQ